MCKHNTQLSDGPVFDKRTKLLISDVDDTLAHAYAPASDTIIRGLNSILQMGVKLFLVTGQSIDNIKYRITDHISPSLRCNILVGCCSGAEVWGFTPDGSVKSHPFYSKYEELLDNSKKSIWRQIVQDIIRLFGFSAINTMPKPQFRAVTNGDPSIIMLEDRQSQITFELVNSTKLTEDQYLAFRERVPDMSASHDLRVSVVEISNRMLSASDIPVTARLAGAFAVDFAILGVTKTTAVHYVLYSELCKEYWGIDTTEHGFFNRVEIWGDKFSVIDGGTDRHICEALPPSVRTIDFRKEKREELPEGYNILIWNGEQQLSEGTEEYLVKSGLV